ncbi:hypothetical protein [Pseudoxanthomonas kaohsiungensis]|uniref:Uncharacterized protein n=1 Tax=Pseudoxanthomonas kaohsiungensis TaxID=283923 RepID=A0ABW3LY00_9GAMM|nr:hypothetical protein [Pseudoxanthomonas kaohsiungensis]KAF1702983.1 hypothetical protein CSC66_09420 [Pseudoxanthomonas kaohsiungensis]
MTTPVYPVTRDTVATAAAGTVARDLSILFPALLASEAPGDQLLRALSELREQALQQRQEATTLLQGRYLELREEILTRVVNDAHRAHQESRLKGFLAAHRPYLVNLVAGRTMHLPLDAPRQPDDNEGWLASPPRVRAGQEPVRRSFQLRSCATGHYLVLVQKAAA